MFILRNVNYWIMLTDQVKAETVNFAVWSILAIWLDKFCTVKVKPSYFSFVNSTVYYVISVVCIACFPFAFQYSILQVRSLGLFTFHSDQTNVPGGWGWEGRALGSGGQLPLACLLC